LDAELLPGLGSELFTAVLVAEAGLNLTPAGGTADASAESSRVVMTRRIDSPLPLPVRCLLAQRCRKAALWVPMAAGASFSPPGDVDNKCDAVTEAGAKVKEANGTVKSCTAAVVEAFMGMVIMGMVIMGMISRVRVKMVLMKDSYPIVT
jgi:hypothetical protein